MKIVIVRFSAELGISDAMYEQLQQKLNMEDTQPAVALETRISTLIGCRVKYCQIYDSWDEAGH